MIQALISGAQSGADMAVVGAAQALDLNFGGYAPKGWKTENGPMPELETMGFLEAPSEDYVERTRLNVMLADATVIFGKRSRGSNRTEEECRQAGKPCYWIMWPVHPTIKGKAVNGTYYDSPNHIAFRLWIARHRVKILNVAGNRESKNPGISEFVKLFLIKALGGNDVKSIGPS